MNTCKVVFLYAKDGSAEEVQPLVTPVPEPKVRSEMIILSKSDPNGSICVPSYRGILSSVVEDMLCLSKVLSLTPAPAYTGS